MLQVLLKFVLLHSHHQDSAAVFQAAVSRLAVSGESAEARSWRHQWLPQVAAQPMHLPFFNRFSSYCKQHFSALVLHSRTLLNLEIENRLLWYGEGTRLAEVRHYYEEEESAEHNQHNNNNKKIHIIINYN